MAQERTYTYRAGERVELTKDNDAFVVRVLPPRSRELGLESVDQLSSASTKVTCGPEELDKVMAETRRRAVAHHVYRTEEGSELLITDRVYVRSGPSSTPTGSPASRPTTAWCCSTRCRRRSDCTS